MSINYHHCYTSISRHQWDKKKTESMSKLLDISRQTHRKTAEWQHTQSEGLHMHITFILLGYMKIWWITMMLCNVDIKPYSDGVNKRATIKKNARKCTNNHRIQYNTILYSFIVRWQNAAQHVEIIQKKLVRVFIQHALDEAAVTQFVYFRDKLPIMAPGSEVVGCATSLRRSLVASKIKVP